MAIKNVSLEIPTRLKNSHTDKSVAEERMALAGQLKAEFSDKAKVSWGPAIYQDPDVAHLEIHSIFGVELTTTLIGEIHQRALDIFGDNASPP